MTAMTTVARRADQRAAHLATLVALVVLALLSPVQVFAGQGEGAGPGSVKQDIERRFDVLPLQNGIALRPKAAHGDVRSVELTGDTIAIDGAPVTGAELRQKLGADADAVIRLSYLDAAARRRLFGRAESGAAGAPPQPSAPPVAPDTPRAPESPVPPEPPRRPRSGHHSDARVRFGGNVTVARDEVIDQDVVTIGGSAEIDGEVNGDVVVVGGSATLGPDARVSGDVTVVGGTLVRDPSARVGGKVNEVGVGAIGDVREWRNRFPGRWFWWNRGLRSSVGMMAAFARYVVLAVLVCLVLLIGREPVRRIAARASAEPVKAGLIGLLAQILFIPLLILTVIVLVVTIIGIPLLVLVPFALLGLAIVALVGFAAVAWEVGRLVAGRFGGDVDNPYVSALTGIAVVLAPVFVARLLGFADGILFPLTSALLLLGVMIEYVAWTVGFGAVVLTRANWRVQAATAATPAIPPQTSDALPPDLPHA